MCGLNSVGVTSQAGAFVESRLEEYVDEKPLAFLRSLLSHPLPHVGDEDDALKRRVSTKLTEHLEISCGDPREPVGNAVDVDYPRKSDPMLGPNQGSLTAKVSRRIELLTLSPRILRLISRYRYHSC